MRRRAKAVNFGIVYGISAFSLSQDIGVTVAEAKAYMEAYFATFPGVRRYMDDVVAQAKERGYVETLFHRRRELPELTLLQLQPPRLWRAGSPEYAHSGHGGGHHEAGHGGRVSGG